MAYGAVAYASGLYGGPAAAPIIPSATDKPKISVQVAFTTNPNDTPAWTILTEDREVLRSFTVNRGRSTELDRFQAGRATITLANEDRRFDPSYASSPYYPNVVPMRRLRILANYGGVDYSVFSGYVDSWEQQYLPPQEAVCVVQATDAFKVFGNAEVASSVYAETIQSAGPSMWWRLGEASGASSAGESITGDHPLTPVGNPTFGAPSLSGYDPDGAAQFAAATDGLQGIFHDAANFPFGAAGSLEFLYRDDSGFSLGPRIAVATLGTPATGVDSINSTEYHATLINSAGTVFDAETSGVDFSGGSIHHVVLTWSAGSQIVIYVDGVDRTGPTATFTGTMANPSAPTWAVAVNAVDYPPLVSSSHPSTWDEISLWNVALTPAQVAAHYAALTTAWAGDKSGARINRILDTYPWPVADRIVDTGASELQTMTLGGSVLSALQKVEETEQGALFVNKNGDIRFIDRNTLVSIISNDTFGDGTGELEYADLIYVYDDEILYNEAVVTREGGVTQVVGDTTSQARYLRRTKVFDGMLYKTDADARGLAEWWIAHYKDPLLRATNMRLEPTAGNSLTHFPSVLGRELMDRVSVRRRPQNLGAAIDQETLIEGITHDVTPDQWITTWNLSPAESQVYWLAEIAGRGEAGVTTRAGF